MATNMCHVVEFADAFPGLQHGVCMWIATLRFEKPTTALPICLAFSPQKKCTGKPGTSTRIENTQPESGQGCKASALPNFNA